MRELVRVSRRSYESSSSLPTLPTLPTRLSATNNFLELVLKQLIVTIQYTVEDELHGKTGYCFHGKTSPVKAKKIEITVYAVHNGTDRNCRKLRDVMLVTS